MTTSPDRRLSFSALRPQGKLSPRLQREYRGRLAHGFGLGLVALYLGAAGGRDVLLEERYRRERVVTTAAVTRLSTTWHGRREAHCVHYALTPDGRKRLLGIGEVPKQRWKLLRRGDIIAVEYLASDPTTNRPQPTTWLTGRWVWLKMLWPLGAGGLSAFLFVSGRRNAAKLRRLLLRGVLISGTIETVERKARRRGGCYVLTCRFEPPEGGSRAHKEIVREDDLPNEPVAGGTVPLVCLPDDPSQCAVVRDRWFDWFHADEAREELRRETARLGET
jgi:hypothetical protein